MRHPGRAYLVLVAEQAEAVFADRAEARDYADQHGEWAHVVVLPWWPAGAWRYGIATARRATADAIPTEALEAQQRHARISRRCAGAGLECLRVEGLARYYCPTCQDRIR